MKDIMGAALLGELVAALAKSAALRRSLGTIAPEDADARIRTMVSEIERLAAEVPVHVTQPPKSRPVESAPVPQLKPGVRAESPVRIPFPAPDQPRATVSDPPARLAPSVPATPPARPVVAEHTGQTSQTPPVPVAARTVPAPVIPNPPRPVAPQPAAVVAQKTTPVPSLPLPEVTARPPARQPLPPANVPSTTHVRPVTVPVPPPPVEEPAPVVALPTEPQSASPLHSPAGRIPMPFENERAFVLAASLIPLQDTPSRDPFKLGVEGVDSGSEMFAIDHAGIRFFLSTMKNPDAGVSKAGMLLLGKQESIKHRSVHERLVNGLRLQSLILPAEAGTVVLGRDDLARRVDFRLSALFEVLLGLSTLSSWRVSAFVLDAQVQKMIPAEASPVRSSRHEGERGRVTSSTKKTDIKTLERILTREKKLAEIILQKLAATADRHTVESMVNLGSGSSEDWKPILRASFEVSTARFAQFARAVVECQDANAMFDPMIAVAGGPGSFSLSM